MLKPFYNKKKNIDDRLVPAVTAADAGKVVGVDEEGNITLIEAGSGGGSDSFNVNIAITGEIVQSQIVFNEGTLDKPIAEVVDAVNTRKYITGVIKADVRSVGIIYVPITAASRNDNNINIEGIKFEFGGTSLNVTIIPTVFNTNGSFSGAEAVINTIPLT